MGSQLHPLPGRAAAEETNCKPLLFHFSFLVILPGVSFSPFQMWKLPLLFFFCSSCLSSDWIRAAEMSSSTGNGGGLLCRVFITCGVTGGVGKQCSIWFGLLDFRLPWGTEENNISLLSEDLFCIRRSTFIFCIASIKGKAEHLVVHFLSVPIWRKPHSEK